MAKLGFRIDLQGENYMWQTWAQIYLPGENNMLQTWASGFTRRELYVANLGLRIPTPFFDL